jgi:transcriptional regulator with XRE-family HTH domain
MAKLSENLEKLMRQHGLSQKGLSVKAGLNETAVRDILRGRSKDPQLSTVRALASVLQCKIEDLYRDNLTVSKKHGSAEEAACPETGTPAARSAVLLNEDMVTIEEINMVAAKGMEALRAGRKRHVLRRWLLPVSFLRQRTATDFALLKIISVEGDAMMPDFLPGDRVIVDISDTVPTPAGVFIVWDGIGHSLRRCAIRPGSKPPVLTLSTGRGNYETHEMLFRDSVIGGCVIAKWQWL